MWFLFCLNCFIALNISFNGAFFQNFAFIVKLLAFAKCNLQFYFAILVDINFYWYNCKALYLGFLFKIQNLLFVHKQFSCTLAVGHKGTCIFVRLDVGIMQKCFASRSNFYKTFCKRNMPISYRLYFAA